MESNDSATEPKLIIVTNSEESSPSPEVTQQRSASSHTQDIVDITNNVASISNNESKGVFMTEVNISDNAAAAPDMNSTPDIELLEEKKTSSNHSQEPRVKSEEKRYMQSRKKTYYAMKYDSNAQFPPVQNLVHSSSLANKNVSRLRNQSKTLFKELQRNGIEYASYHAMDNHYTGMTKQGKPKTGQRFLLSQSFKPNSDEFAPSLFNTTKNYSSNAVAQDDKMMTNSTPINEEKNNLQSDHRLTDTFSSKSKASSNHSVKTRSLPPSSNSSRTIASLSSQGTHTAKHASSKARSVMQVINEEKSPQSTISTRSKNSSLSKKKDNTSLQLNGTEMLQKLQGDNASVHTNSAYTSLSEGLSPSKAPSYFTIGSDADEDRIVRLEESLKREEDATRTVKKALSELKERQEMLLKKLEPNDRNQYVATISKYENSNTESQPVKQEKGKFSHREYRQSSNLETKRPMNQKEANTCL